MFTKKVKTGLLGLFVSTSSLLAQSNMSLSKVASEIDKQKSGAVSVGNAVGAIAMVGLIVFFMIDLSKGGSNSKVIAYCGVALLIAIGIMNII